jgi:hypothetical protein
LENGDPPMGVAFGKFLPTPEYDEIRKFVIDVRDEVQSHLELRIVEVGGQELVCQGGIRISDYSNDLGLEGLEVTAFGIGYPRYAELFPERVAAYHAQFSK